MAFCMYRDVRIYGLFSNITFRCTELHLMQSSLESDIRTMECD